TRCPEPGWARKERGRTPWTAQSEPCDQVAGGIISGGLMTRASQHTACRTRRTPCQFVTAYSPSVQGNNGDLQAGQCLSRIARGQDVAGPVHALPIRHRRRLLGPGNEAGALDERVVVDVARAVRIDPP